jgi:hypothetical protein
MTKVSSVTNLLSQNPNNTSNISFGDAVAQNVLQSDKVKITVKYKPNILDRIDAVDHINPNFSENTPTYGGFYTGFAINTLQAGMGGIAGIAKNFPRIKGNPAAKKLVDAIENFVEENPFVKDFFRLEYDQGLTKASGVLHLKFVVKCLQLVPKERRNKALSGLNEILKNHSGPHTLGSTKAIAALINMLDSKKLSDTITRKMEFRVSLNPNVVVGNKKGLEARTGLHFSENVPLKKTFSIPGLKKLFTGAMSVVFFVSPRFYPNGTIKIVHGAEFNFPTKLGYNNFIPFGFVNSIEGTFLFKQDGYLGIEVTDGKWKGFMRLPENVAKSLKAFNLLGTQGVKESKEKKITLAEYVERKFSKNLPPAVVKQVVDIKKKADDGQPLIQLAGIAATSVNAGISTKMAVNATKVAAKPVGQTITKIAVKITPKAVPLLTRVAPWLAKSGIVAIADYLAWPVAILTGAHMLYEYNQEKDFQKSVEILTQKSAYKPDVAVPAALALMNRSGEYFVGSEAKVLSAVIDNAVTSGKADPIELRQEWSKKLNFVGKNLKETKLVRVLAATILGRTDIVQDNLAITKLENSQALNKMFSREDAVAISQMSASVSTVRDPASKTLSSVSKLKDVNYKRVGLGYRSIETNFAGTKLKAIPGEVTDSGKTKWQITATSDDGLVSVFYKTLNRQFIAADVASSSALRKNIENSFQVQRTHFTKTPAYIKPWQGKMYGNLVSAKPLYMTKDGSIMWKVVASANGKTATVYESLGLQDQTGYQFDSSDLQNGHIFKIRLDNILSGREKQ